MSVRFAAIPFNRIGPRTIQAGSTRTRWFDSIIAASLFALACGVTLTIWWRDPLPERIYELGACVLAAVALGSAAGKNRVYFQGSRLCWAAMLVIALWGFGQLAGGWTVYRWITLDGALRMAALAATGVTARSVFRRAAARDALLAALTWFAFLLSGLSVLAYFTSVGKVLWLIPAPYPDVWGPFLSRNNFAQFLELALPVALVLGLKTAGRAFSARPRPKAMGRHFLGMAAVLFAAGLASASRAGAAVLVAESVAVFWLTWARSARGSHRLTVGRALLVFVAGGVLFGALAGVGNLWSRLHKSDPLEVRREIYRSTLEMIAAHPIGGSGLGTFSTVYPAYASFDAGTVEHAHSDWLEWVAEGGFAYGVVWGVLAISLIPPAAGSIWGLGVPAVFIHALVDYPFARLGVAAWVFLLAGAMEAGSGSHGVGAMGNGTDGEWDRWGMGPMGNGTDGNGSNGSDGRAGSKRPDRRG